MALNRRCVVVGGGIAGLSAAIAMRKAGYETTVFEQAPKLAPIGAALSIWGNAMAGLDWLGCGDAVRERAPSGFVRAGLRALLRLPPPAIDRRQFRSRIAVPRYA